MAEHAACLSHVHRRLPASPLVNAAQVHSRCDFVKFVPYKLQSLTDAHGRKRAHQQPFGQLRATRTDAGWASSTAFLLPPM